MSENQASVERVIFNQVPWDQPWRQLRVRYERAAGALWYAMDPRPRPSFNPELLAEIRLLQRSVVSHVRSLGDPDPIQYLVAESAVPGVFNLGGDLNLFTSLIRAGDREGLVRYGVACIDVLYANAIHLECPLTTISLVQGKALGGGFEAAISSNVVVAERSAQMGFPEVLFNLFPGMGAYTLLRRRLSPVQAERMMTDGRVYGAEELHEMGLVDVLADDGKGPEEVYAYLDRQRKYGNAMRAMQQVRDLANPVSYDELQRVVLVWVDAALMLEERDLRLMEKLVRAQGRIERAGGLEEQAPPVPMATATGRRASVEAFH
jgi:DSF synthase